MPFDSQSRDAQRLGAARAMLDAMLTLEGASPAANLRIASALVADAIARARDAGLSDDELEQVRAEGEALARGAAPSPHVDEEPAANGDEEIFEGADVIALPSAESAPGSSDEPMISAHADVEGDDEEGGDELFDMLFDQLTDDESAAAEDELADQLLELPADALTPLEPAATFDELPSTQEVELTSFLRQHTRFETSDKVVVELRGRDDLRELYTRDISKGGMFLATDDPPPIGAMLTVTVQTPDGALDLPGRVVHVMTTAQAAEVGGAPGVGVQFDDLTEDTVSRLEGYVEGLATELETAAHTDLSGPAQRARDLMRAVERNALYEAVGLPPDAEREAVKHRLGELSSMFQDAESAADDAERQRFSNALRTLQRLSAVLLDATRRLAYDFQHGHQRIAERMAAAGETELSRLRAVWRKVLPDRVQEANRLVGEAIAANREADYEVASTRANAAIEHDPFNPQLRKRAQQWSTLYQALLLIRGEERDPDEWLGLAREHRLDAATLRALWSKEHPDRMEAAKELGAKAVQAENIKRVDLALESAKAALALDPFNATLRRAIDKWAEAA